MNDQYVMPLFIAATILFVVLVFFIIFFVLVNKQKQNKLLLDKQRAIFEEQERTMTQISKELHDNLGGLLSLTIMNMKMIGELATSSKQEEFINNASEILHQLSVDVHNMSHSMNSEHIKHRGLYDILQGQLKYINSAKPIKCDIESIGEEDLLSLEEQLLVYRIAQEAIQNVIKHADASYMKIVLSGFNNHFTMIVTDNGKGFNPSVQKVVGIGLMNMKERANYLKGKLDIKSDPGTGTSVILQVSKNRQ